MSQAQIPSPQQHEEALKTSRRKARAIFPCAGVVSFHGSQLAYKPGDRNFTQSSSNLTVVIQNGYIDPSNNASQLASLQEELQRALVPFYLTNYGETRACTDLEFVPRVLISGQQDCSPSRVSSFSGLATGKCDASLLCR